MKKKNDTKFKNSGWCFAIMNGRLAEIHFEKGFGIWAHAYVRREEFSKREQKMIDEDIKKCVFSYRKGSYYDRVRKTRHKVPNITTIFPDMHKKGRALTPLKDL